MKKPFLIGNIQLHDGGIWSKVDQITRNTHLIDTFKKLKKAHKPHYQDILSNKIFYLYLKRITLMKNIRQKLKTYFYAYSQIKLNRHIFVNIIKLQYYLIIKKKD